MLAAFVSSFVTLFIVIDPIMVTPIFASLTHGEAPARQRRLALEATLIAAGILAFFGFAGEAMLHHLGITMPAFRTAGGILLFLMGFRMFFAPDSETEARTPGPKASARENPAFFPIAMPLLAGPGAIATMMLLMHPGEAGWSGQAMVMAAMLATLVVGFVIMMFAAPISNALGRTGQNMISRLLGMLLMALSTQYVFDGVVEGVLKRAAA